MIDINGSLFIQMANFLVLVFLMNYVLYRPIRSILKERRETMDSLSAEAQRSSARLAEVEDELKEIIRQANSDGFELWNQLKMETERQETDKLASLQADLESEEAKAKSEIQGQVDQVRQSLLAQVGVFSSSMAEKVLGRSLI